MAISAPTTIFDDISSYDVGSYASSSFTPVAGRHYVFEIGIDSNNTLGTISSVIFSGTGLTPIVIDDRSGDAGLRRVAVYQCICTAGPTAGTITVNTSGGVGQVIAIRIYERTGVDPNTPVPAGNIHYNADIGTSATVSMGAFVNGESNTIIVAIGTDTTTVTVSSPMVEESPEQTGWSAKGGPDCTLGSAYAPQNVATPALTFTDSLAWAAIGFEIASAGVGGGGSSPTITPTGLALAITLGTPAPLEVFFPTGQAMSISLGTPTIPSQTILTLNPSGFLLSWTQGTFTTENDITMLPAGGPLGLSLGTVSIRGDTLQVPTGFLLTISRGSPGVNAGSSPLVIPLGLVISSTLGSVGINTRVFPPGLTALAFTVGTPSIGLAGQLAVIPTGLAITSSIGTVTMVISPSMLVAGFPIGIILGNTGTQVTGAVSGPKSGDGGSFSRARFIGGI